MPEDVFNPGSDLGFFAVAGFLFFCERFISITFFIDLQLQVGILLQESLM